MQTTDDKEAHIVIYTGDLLVMQIQQMTNTPSYPYDLDVGRALASFNHETKNINHEKSLLNFNQVISSTTGHGHLHTLDRNRLRRETRV